MSKYIDADALEKYLWEESESDFWIGDPKVSVTYKDISIYVAKMPAADVRENVHGEWLADEEGAVYCSECLQYPFEYHIAGWSSDFCQHCGADMRKGV